MKLEGFVAHITIFLQDSTNAFTRNTIHLKMGKIRIIICLDDIRSSDCFFILVPST